MFVVTNLTLGRPNCQIRSIPNYDSAITFAYFYIEFGHTGRYSNRKLLKTGITNLKTIRQLQANST